MKNKFIKKSIITSSILGTAVVATPAILTSCSVLDKDNQNIENPSTWKEIDSIDFVENLSTREFVDSNNLKKNAFWLDSKDFHGYKNPNVDVATLYNQIVTDRKDFIKRNGFEYIKSNLLNETKESYFKQIDNSSLINIIKLIKDINFYNLNNNSNISNEIVMKGESINLNAISSQVDIVTKLTFTDRVVGENVSSKESEQYSFEFIITPKKGYKWKGVDDYNSNSPLIITINDYIDNVAIIPNFNDMVLHNNSHILLTHLFKNEFVIKHDLDFNDLNSFKNQIYKKLNIKSSRYVISNGYNVNDKVDDYNAFIDFINDISNKTPFQYISTSNVSNFNFLLDNFRESMKNKRINVTVKELKYTEYSPNKHYGYAMFYIELSDGFKWLMHDNDYFELRLSFDIQ